MSNISRREFYQNAIKELTVISSLLSGFSFTSMTIILTNTSSVVFSQNTFLVVALATCTLATASIIGALFSIFHLAQHQKKPIVFAVWFFLVIGGIFLFFDAITLLAFSFSHRVGIICAIASALALLLVLWAWIIAVSASDDFAA
jgi:hypothetical protein